MYVKDVMTKNVITVNEETAVEDCAKLLIENKISSLPVTTIRNEIVGIVTEKDLIKRASHVQVPAAIELLGGFIYLDSPKKFMEELKQAMSQKAGGLMSREVVAVNLDDTIEHAATIMVNKNFKRLPVVDHNDHLVGIISRRDIMSHLYLED
ncbi:CBS domain-containing protein [Evansella sp. AB-P1]|uniref:CBS domain-containing protein n=1 Tax=Evansella sp. AB-P1 TaxID=3037653 RepID=UPI0024203EC5|nr:CBS domain-containing protein [Evansella sp. AB-P1]MDG5788576.1 CBS domain-containing protein [Evansella sp. AB-P1]